MKQSKIRCHAHGCNVNFTPERPNRIYCSDYCKHKNMQRRAKLIAKCRAMMGAGKIFDEITKELGLKPKHAAEIIDAACKQNRNVRERYEVTTYIWNSHKTVDEMELFGRIRPRLVRMPKLVTVNNDPDDVTIKDYYEHLNAQ